MNFHGGTKLVIGGWLGALFLLVVWSYGLVDGNLTLINHPLWMSWQIWAWQWSKDSALVVRSLVVVLTMIWMAYAGLLWLARRKKLGWWLLLPTIGLLLLGHNAQSHDIFNYIFNAKMLTVYQVDPHVRVALDFAGDPWLRFMHNVHTPAPYGHEWTYWSAVPFVLSGLGKSFLLSYVAMKTWMLVGWLAWLGAVWWMVRRAGRSSLLLWPLALHPLVLIETLVNGHNDVWFMAPAVAALALVLGARRTFRQDWWRWVVALILLMLSIWMKVATVVLIPVLALLWVSQYGPIWRAYGRRLARWWPEWAVLLLLLPLVTTRSQQFHPWYLIWALSFSPLVRWQWLRFLLYGLALASTFRYLPWLSHGLQYDNLTLFLMKAITASGIGLGILWWGKRRYFSAKHTELSSP